MTLPGVTVRNLTSKLVVSGTDAGQFTIAANVGDLLEFSLSGFGRDTLYLVDLKPKRIYLTPSSKNLKEVDIVSTKVSPYLDVTNPNAKPSTRVSTDGIEGKKNNDRAGGVRLALGYGKYRREQDKVRMLEERDAVYTEISANFNEQTVGELTKLKGAELKEFMNMYRPTTALVLGERPFNYPYYIAEALQKWRNLTPEQRRMPPMQKLQRK